MLGEFKTDRYFFSKTVENRAYARAFHMMVTSSSASIRSRSAKAIAAGVSSRLGRIGDLAKLVEDTEPLAEKRGAYEKIIHH